MTGRRSRDGRVYQPELMATARAVDRADDEQAGVTVEILAPSPGLWRGAPPPGAVIRPGDPLGELEVLGVLHCVIAPAEAIGAVVATPHTPSAARRALSFGETMLVLDPDAAGQLAAAVERSAGAEAERDGRQAFRAPTSGRYYSRPGPDKALFVTVGDELAVGATVCLLEVMKTFNRVTYGGAGLPDPGRVVEIAPDDGDDLAAGDVILYLE